MKRHPWWCGDASGGQTVFSVIFRVLPVNDSPSATPARWERNEDQRFPFRSRGSTLTGTLWSFEVVRLPEHGHFVRHLTLVVYTPDADYFGNDTFGFTSGMGIRFPIPIRSS